ncbi:MAG TPA: GNAT family N-acetyltransferase [Longimicrobiales bacterium]
MTLSGLEHATPARAARPYGPAYRFETARLCARCWTPADAPLLRTALDENDAYLRPWIPWMREEPKPLEGTIQKLRNARAAFDSDIDFRYGLYAPGAPAVIGEIALLGRIGPAALEIGYWVDHRLAGRGLATEAAGAVVRLAFETRSVERVEIHHSAGNDASGAVPRKLGFTLEATMRRRAHDADDVVRDLSIWTMFADEYERSPARRQDVRAWDALGTPFVLSA